MGYQYVVESCMSSMLASNRWYKGVRLGQVNLFPPGSLIIASKWLSGGGRVSEHETAAYPDLDTLPMPPFRFFVPSLTPSSGSSKS